MRAWEWNAGMRECGNARSLAMRWRISAVITTDGRTPRARRVNNVNNVNNTGRMQCDAMTCIWHGTAWLGLRAACSEAGRVDQGLIAIPETAFLSKLSTLWIRFVRGERRLEARGELACSEAIDRQKRVNSGTDRVVAKDGWSSSACAEQAGTCSCCGP
jgi:hypothetical protein